MSDDIQKEINQTENINHLYGKNHTEMNKITAQTKNKKNNGVKNKAIRYTEISKNFNSLHESIMALKISQYHA